MPQAIMHVLLTIIVIDLFRDYVIKKKRLIPLHFVFLGGIAGLLPDIDVPLFWLINNVLGISVPYFHRILSHSLVIPAIFLLISLVYLKFNKKRAILFGIISFGTAFHIFLDFLFVGLVMPFYPFSTAGFGLNLLYNEGIPALLEGVEAMILIAWLYHEEKRHKISDFI